MRRSLILMLAALVAMTLWAVPASAASPAKITVVHGIPGDALGLDKALPVDVCLADGSQLLGSVSFKGSNAAAPLQVPAGTYDIEVRLDTDPAASCEGAAVLAAPLTVESGKAYTAVAALTAGLVPGAADQLGLGIDLFAFQNNANRIGALKARATLGHFADAPAVDIYTGLLKGKDNRFMRELFTGVPNGVAASRDFFFGMRWFGLAVSPSAGPEDIVIGPVRQGLDRRANTFILAVGSLDKGSGSPFGLGSFDFVTYTQR
ncbi:MAG: DUF4397 domain-containing protein [Acidimicrobiia bacterium]|nr:DUF4397 domain-containing protein [Acidimicrobiia bacterium]